MLKISQPIPEDISGGKPDNWNWKRDPIQELRQLLTEVEYMRDKIDAVVNGDLEPYELDVEYLRSNAKDVLRRIENFDQVERPKNKSPWPNWMKEHPGAEMGGSDAAPGL